MSVTSVRRVLLAALLVVCIAAPSSASASSRHDRTEAKIIRAMNKVRATHGLPKLRTNSGLARAADAHSKVDAAHEHASATATTRGASAATCARSSVGENIAWTRGCSAQKIVNMWLNSAPHRHVMLSASFRRIGVGQRGAEQCFVTADFASAIVVSIQRRHTRGALRCALPCGERSSIPSRRRWDARLLCVVYLLASPATADMAAHSYRAWLFEHEGLTVWNAQWYGGHHVLGYSLLFAPLAAAFGPAIVGVLSAVAAVALFVPLARARGAVARRRRPRRRGCSRPGCSRTSRSGGCRSCSGSRSRSAPGRRRARATRARGRPRRSCAMLASPVAGVFLMLGAAAKLIADGRPALRTAAVARGCPRSPAGSGSTCCSRRAGRTASPRPRSGRCS